MSELDYQVGGTHYKQFKIQPAEFFANLENNYGYILNYYQSSVIRYITRFRQKNGLQDLEKVKQICRIAIEFKLNKRKDNQKVYYETNTFCYENQLSIYVSTIVMLAVQGKYEDILKPLDKLIKLEYPKDK